MQFMTVGPMLHAGHAEPPPSLPPSGLYSGRGGGGGAFPVNEVIEYRRVDVDGDRVPLPRRQ